MTRTLIQRELKKACLALWSDKLTTLFAERSTMIDESIGFPREFKFGDFTTNVAMQLAGRVNVDPLTITELLIERLQPALKSTFSKIESIPPGYINFYFAKPWLNRQMGRVLREKQKFGRSTIGKNEKVMIEFISANPTGPLTLGNGRGGFFGDVLGNVLRVTGHKVRKEYYMNDIGKQVDILAESVTRRSLQLQGINVTYPENCYQGGYITDLAARLKLENVRLSNLDTIKQKVKVEVLRWMIDDIRTTVRDILGIKFDYWFRESSLYGRGKIEQLKKILAEKDLAYVEDGALWFASEQFGDDKDRVLVKNTGESTYFLSDIAYHQNKFVERKFDRVIDVWGADHHGYVKRLQVAVRAIGIEKPLDIVIMQLVRLMKNGQEVRMSKRTGTFVTLKELVKEVGLDVTRFFFLMRAPNTHMDFDMDLAKDTSEKNPVYYVQYAHARIANIFAKIRESQPRWAPKGPIDLRHVAELNLARRIAQYPDILVEVARSSDVHRLPYYAIELADAFHGLYDELRVIDNGVVDESRARLAAATKIVLGSVLSLMGIAAPERMEREGT